jgi:hypothetical protein
MAVITMPADLAVRDFTWGQRRYDIEASSDVNGSSQARLFGPPRWLCSFQCPPGVDADDAGLWESTLLQLRGRVNHLAAWDRNRPAPRGTLRGSPTLNATVAAGATSMVLTGGVGTNLLTYSKSFDNAAWVKQQATVTANATTAPDGTTTADKLIATAVTNVHQMYPNSASVSSGSVYTYSIYAKAAELNRCELQFNSGAGSFGTSVAAAFRLDTGVVASVSSGSSAAIEAVGGDWYRCSLTTPAASVTGSIVALVQLANTAESFLGDGTSGMFFWGAQLEASAAASAYEPAGGSVKAGDWIGLGSGVGTSQLVKATATVQASEAGLLTVPFEPPARIAFSSGGAVTWDKPPAYFKQQSNEWAGRGITSQVFAGYGLDLLEDWTP